MGTTRTTAKSSTTPDAVCADGEQDDKLVLDVIHCLFPDDVQEFPLLPSPFVSRDETEPTRLALAMPCVYTYRPYHLRRSWRLSPSDTSHSFWYAYLR